MEGRAFVAEGSGRRPLSISLLRAARACEKITFAASTSSGRDAVSSVRIGFPVVDARQRVPTVQFFTAPLRKEERTLSGSVWFLDIPFRVLGSAHPSAKKDSHNSPIRVSGTRNLFFPRTRKLCENPAFQFISRGWHPVNSAALQGLSRSKRAATGSAV
jgi:hypothetical protein